MEANNEKYTVYILKLQENKYYIERTQGDVNKRIDQHKKGNGSEWTKQYSFVSVDKIIEDADAFDEDKYTKQYMFQYGIDNVRGAGYCKFIIPKEQEQALEKERCSYLDLCYICKDKGHFANRCQNKSPIKVKEDIMDELDENLSKVNISLKLKYNKCYAKTHLNGKSLE